LGVEFNVFFAEGGFGVLMLAARWIRGGGTSMRDLEKEGRTLGRASTRVTLNLSAISVSTKSSIGKGTREPFLKVFFEEIL
jgi:hypothetical protein